MPEIGKYIVIEGMDATGKSLQVERLVGTLGQRGIRSIQVHEPDGFAGDESLGLPPVPAATELRKIIKNGSIERDAWTNVLMFTAARRANWTQAMEPALKMGVWVVAARNWLSTVAYQGYGEGIDINKIGITTKEMVSDKYAHPNLTMILTLGDEIERAKRRDGRGALENPDTFESRPQHFQDKVASGYLQYVAIWDEDIPLIDASGTPDEVEKLIWQQVSPLV